MSDHPRPSRTDSLLTAWGEIPIPHSQPLAPRVRGDSAVIVTQWGDWPDPVEESR